MIELAVISLLCAYGMSRLAWKVAGLLLDVRWP